MSSWFTGVAIVTSADADDRPHGLTCTSLSSVALDPPTLLVCLQVGSGTLAAIQERRAFVVNLLHNSGQAAAERFASPEPDRFAHVRWRPAPLTGLPWFAHDAFAMAECQVADSAIVGDHVIICGTVENVVTDGGRPLLYGARAFHTPYLSIGAS
ncbi:flavin reductase family protein [Streptosporangium subroseum]|uniref:flavin reductase family protein n=1 Tax=Streptosporangium subroseum TaxID=106412 RepID=UPI0030924548|nr:flavin reductase family protein [Streptosporangium subroseum]